MCLDRRANDFASEQSWSSRLFETKVSFLRIFISGVLVTLHFKQVFEALEYDVSPQVACLDLPFSTAKVDINISVRAQIVFKVLQLFGSLLLVCDLRASACL